jgi:hypothetical protein
VATSDDIKCEWPDGASDVGFEPGGDFVDFETGDAGRCITHAPVRYLRTALLVCVENGQTRSRVSSRYGY